MIQVSICAALAISTFSIAREYHEPRVNRCRSDQYQRCLSENRNGADAGRARISEMDRRIAEISSERDSLLQPFSKLEAQHKNLEVNGNFSSMEIDFLLKSPYKNQKKEHWIEGSPTLNEVFLIDPNLLEWRERHPESRKNRLQSLFDLIEKERLNIREARAKFSSDISHLNSQISQLEAEKSQLIPAIQQHEARWQSGCKADHCPDGH